MPQHTIDPVVLAAMIVVRLQTVVSCVVAPVSEDFPDIPNALGIPYTYWSFGCTDRKVYRAAEKEGKLQDLPTNHSPKFLPPMQPCLRTGTEALVSAALAWLARH